jgi:RNA-directed DNA polymerase
VLVHGTQADAQALREETARVLAPMGLRLSKAKTQIVRAPRAQRERLGL